MSEDQIKSKKPRPWYLGWRGVVAALGVAFVLYAMFPSKERQVAMAGDRVFSQCMDENEKAKDKMSDEVAKWTCECVKDVLEKQFREGKPKEEFTGGWYALTSHLCLMSNPVFEKEIENGRSTIGERG